MTGNCIKNVDARIRGHGEKEKAPPKRGLKSRIQNVPFKATDQRPLNVPFGCSHQIPLPTR
jgi:hypothetical protein